MSDIITAATFDPVRITGTLVNTNTTFHLHANEFVAMGTELPMSWGSSGGYEITIAHDAAITNTFVRTTTRCLRITRPDEHVRKRGFCGCLFAGEHSVLWSSMS